MDSQTSPPRRPLLFWNWFWTINFVVAGAAFAAIALTVAVRGVTDLRAMLRALRGESEQR